MYIILDRRKIPYCVLFYLITQTRLPTRASNESPYTMYPGVNEVKLV